jgi:hypothetical protein
MGGGGNTVSVKHKEVMIGKLEPRMDANEREFLMSYKNP